MSNLKQELATIMAAIIWSLVYGLVVFGMIGTAYWCGCGEVTP